MQNFIIRSSRLCSVQSVCLRSLFSLKCKCGLVVVVASDPERKICFSQAEGKFPQPMIILCLEPGEDEKIRGQEAERRGKMFEGNFPIFVRLCEEKQKPNFPLPPTKPYG